MTDIFQDKNIFIPFILSFGVVIIGLGLIFIYLDSAGPLIIHFEARKGIDFIGSIVDVYGIVAVNLTIILVNAILAEATYRRERLLSYIFAYSSVLISVLILAGIGVIISVN